MRLANHAGKVVIKTTSSHESSFSYQKKEWKEWCLLKHKEEGGKVGIQVENTSFTGKGGCVLEWEVSLSQETSLVLDQAAGSIAGVGALKLLTINLAAGDLKWKDGNMPFTMNVAAGKVTLENMNFPTEGVSLVYVGTGSVDISSPESTLVTTEIKSAIGSESNDFSTNKNGHKLTIQVAVGKANHFKK